jgi:hypothetical protein
MQKMTSKELEKVLQQVLDDVRRGRRHRIQLDALIIKRKPSLAELNLAQYTPKQRDIIRRGWSPEMALHLTNPNPNWDLEPNFLPTREPDDYHDPFADTN